MASSHLGAVQGFVPPKNYISSPTADFLLDKIKWVYGLCIIATASLCVYNLARGWQLLRNPSIPLRGEFKPLKCRILLAEIDEKLKNNASADMKSHFQACNTLLSSMPLPDRQEFLPKLIAYYSKTDSDYACMLARQLSSTYDIFRAAQCLKDLASPASSKQIHQLYKQGFQIRLLDHAKHIKDQGASPDAGTALEYAQAFYSLGDDQLKNEALSLAWDCVDKRPNQVMKLHQICSIAKTYEKLQDTEQVKKTLEKALEISNQIPSPTDSIHALFAVANLFFDFKDYAKMQTVLDRLFEAQKESQKITGVTEKLKLAAKISAEPSAPMPLQLKNLSAETHLDQLFHNLQSTPPEDIPQRVRDYGELASAYHEFKLNDQAQKALACALLTIEPISIEEDRLCTDSEGNKTTIKVVTDAKIKTKFDLLRYFTFYDYSKQISDDTVQKILKQLKDLYAASHEPRLKNSIGILLLKLCNRKNQAQASNEVFKQYLADHLAQKKDAVGKIFDLTSDAFSMDGLFDSGLNPEQYRLMLEAAEKLLPQVPSLSQVSMVSRISQGYLKLSWQKSLEILNNYESKRTANQAIEHLTTGAITTIALGVLYVSPQVGAPLLSCCAALYSLYQSY